MTKTEVCRWMTRPSRSWFFGKKKILDQLGKRYPCLMLNLRVCGHNGTVFSWLMVCSIGNGLIPRSRHPSYNCWFPPAWDRIYLKAYMSLNVQGIWGSERLLGNYEDVLTGTATERTSSIFVGSVDHVKNGSHQVSLSGVLWNSTK